MQKKNLIGTDVLWLEYYFSAIGVDKSYAIKLMKWIYRKRVFDYGQINDIPKGLLYEVAKILNIGLFYPSEVLFGSDGSTKFLYQNDSDMLFESVLMSAEKRNTLCVSSQSGCRMGCKFCMTGSVGFKGNLTSRDILNQLLAIPNSKEVNRIVIMGMGEPFDNSDEVLKAIRILTADWGCAFGKTNITLSSVGILNELESFLNNPLCNLAISLHSPFRDERSDLMPIEKSNPIEEVVNLIRNNPLPKPLRVSFEYVALSGVNLSNNHAVAIAVLLKGIPCHLNIIPWNSHENAKFNTPKDEELQLFIAQLNALGVLTTVRKSLANDIGAACGQMAGRKRSL
jgi:23S rRNA (adenine2503-C2)-methyltransferase